MRKNSVRTFVRKVSLCRVLTCLCTHCVNVLLSVVPGCSLHFLYLFYVSIKLNFFPPKTCTLHRYCCSYDRIEEGELAERNKCSID
jgi:hypothetical protein